MSLSDIAHDKMHAYQCRRIERPIELTGRCDDPQWQRADAVCLVDVIAGHPAEQKTEVRLLYDESVLYIAFTCEDDFVWGTLLERDASIYNEECVEVFLCPSGKLRQYYEINVSPLNTVFDAIVLNGRSVNGLTRALTTLDAYDCDGLVTNVSVNGELGVKGSLGWSAEYAIPFAALIGHDNLTPDPGDEWRMNLYRIDMPDPKAEQVLYAWAPTGRPDFHLPWRFGRLVFA